MATVEFFLNPQSVQAAVPAATFERAKALYLLQHVLDCDVSFSSSREWDLAGQVQGSERSPYWVTAKVEINPVGNLSAFESECTCPVGRNCKHGVALTLKAAYRSARKVNSPGEVTIIRPAQDAAPLPRVASAEEIAAQEAAELKATEEATRIARARESNKAQLQIGQWMEALETGTDGTVDEMRQMMQRKQDPDKQVVYTLSPERRSGVEVLQINFGQASALRKGGWSKVQVNRYLDNYSTNPADMEVVNLVRSLAGTSASYSSGPFVLAGQTGMLALQLAASMGRLFTLSAERTLGVTLKIGPARTPYWYWQEAANTKLGETTWSLRARLEEGESDDKALATCFANNPPLYIDRATGHVGVLEMPDMTANQLCTLLKAPAIPLSLIAQNEIELLRHLAGLPLPPVIQPPELIKGGQPEWQLHLEPVAKNQADELGLMNATLRFGYGELTFFSLSQQNPYLVDLPARGERDAQSVTRKLLERDLPHEQQAIMQLHQLGLVGDAKGHFGLPIAQDQNRWLQWADDGFAVFIDAGFSVTQSKTLDNWIARADNIDVNMAGLGGDLDDADDLQAAQSPWFDLSLGIEINGERHNILPLLPTLLERLSSYSLDGGNLVGMPEHVYLPDARGEGYLRLPTAPLKPWLQALLELVGERSRDLDGDSLRLSRFDAMRMGTALGAGAQWSGAASLQAMVQQLQTAAALPAVALPSGLQATLRPYQQQGVNWLQFMRTHSLGGILADDMGLGKTLQTLTHLLIEKEQGRLDRPAMIIAPVSLMGNWRREAQRFTPDLKVMVLHGADRHEVATEIAEHDVVIVPYSLLQRDRDRWVKQAWHIVVLDEAQNIKNANSNAAQVVSELNTRHRLCLSGTPMENHLGELWSLFHFLMPGFLGSQARFKDLFRTPIEKYGDAERLDQLRRRVTPFMLRRNKSDVATDLPPKIEVISSVELSDAQANLYETIRLTTEKAVRESLNTKGLAGSQIQVLDALLKLRQVCCDPRLVPLDAAKKIKQSAKLELLMELLPEMLNEGRKVLLFSQFTSMLTLIEAELKSRDIPWVKLTGQSQHRDDLIDQFTSGKVPLFLISLKAGGVGLNLPQADTVIHYDPWWNPAVENQATDRAHRIGQTQQVMVYKLVAQGTIEERILALQERKAELAKSMYSGAIARKEPMFSEMDVAELLKPLG